MIATCLFFVVALLSNVLTISITSENKGRPTLALCLITKDENLDILEWIEYHYSIGVTNIIIMEHNSSISILESIKNYTDSGFVHHYSYFKNFHKNNQLYAYDFCIQNFGKQFTHMGFIDTDEFIIIKNNSATIIDVLENYKDYGGLTLNWMFFGSSGHIERPTGGILQNYNKCSKNYHVKSIIKTNATIGTSDSPHHFLYKDNHYAVDTNFQKVNGSFNPTSRSSPSPTLYDIMYINHYVIKSFDDFRRKHLRGSATKGVIGRKRMNFFQTIDTQTVQECDYVSSRHLLMT